VAGSYTLTFSGSAGSISSTANLVATVQTSTPPSFFFPTPLFSEVAVSFGASSQVQVTTLATPPASYDVQLSLSGLPPGTSATINPSIITVGQSATITITAASTAPFAQNVSITLTGTPGAPVPSASLGFLLDVTPKPGSLPNNRTDYVATEATPYAAVYDPTHRLIFASNDSWNRVEVISSTTGNNLRWLWQCVLDHSRRLVRCRAGYFVARFQWDSVHHIPAIQHPWPGKY
jgi:hypothetical protein